MIQMPIDQVRSTGRVAMGVKMVNLGDSDTVSNIAKVGSGMAEIERLASEEAA